MHDARLINLLPPERTVAIRVESVADFSLQPTLWQAQEHGLNFGSDVAEIICERLERDASESAIRLELSQRAVNQHVFLKTLDGRNTTRRQSIFIVRDVFRFSNGDVDAVELLCAHD